MEVIYKNAEYSIEERVQNLLSLMTLEEKLEQMHVVPNVKQIVQDIENGTLKHFFGGYFNIESASPADMYKIQEYALTKTRLGIPVMMYGEGLHGLLYKKATVFPQNIGLSCSFNEELVQSIAEVIGEQAASLGFNQLFAPNLDLVRELRWGRIQEDYGEDPYLTGTLGAAYVRGLQSKNVVSTVKHYLAHGTPENGINLSSVHIGEREVREMMLPPFEKCIRAGAMSVMPAYNEMDGVPVHASRKWLTEVLRGELGFDGTVISDWIAFEMLHRFHQTAETALDIGKQAIHAGVDIEAPNWCGYADEFKKAVAEGIVDESLLDGAVSRILTLKFKLGLFDKELLTKKKLKTSKKYTQLARKAAEQSIVLLKNDGVLPLIDKNTKIGLFGPNAALAQIGDYSCEDKEENIISLYKGLQKKVGEKNILYAKGCDTLYGTEEGLQEAVAVAQQADILVLALGDNSNHFGGVGWGNEDIREPVTCAEGFDMHFLELPQSQINLFNTLKATGKKLVLVLYTGRPMAIVEQYEKADAVLQAWYPGEQGGNVIADILYGEVNPTGKLTVSFPRSTGHIPCNYNHRKSARGRFCKRPGSMEKPGKDYVTAPPTAFLPFGFGLGYVPIRYDWLKTKRLGDHEFEVRVKIVNEGDRDTEESVLLFVSCDYCEIVPYVKQLKAFKRVKVKAGKSKIVTLKLDEEAFRYIDINMQKGIAKGSHTLTVQNLETKIMVK